MAITHKWLASLIFIFISVPTIAFYLYDIHCTFVGQCNIWGWIKTVMFIINMVFIIIMLIIIIIIASTVKREIKASKKVKSKKKD